MRTQPLSSPYAGFQSESVMLPDLGGSLIGPTLEYFLDCKLNFPTGVAYAVEDGPDYDPLTNPAQCELDAALMETLGVNAIRVYTVNYEDPHDECMRIFADVEIYVLADLTTPKTGFDRVEPEWTMDMFNNYTKTLDAFAKYDNFLAAIVGNEVINGAKSTITAPFIKAAIRDVKAYRDGQGYRQIPIGYSAADDNEVRLASQEYLVCGENISSNADFWALNRYSWCGDSTFTQSGYSDLNDDAKDYPVPIFFSETGCQLVGKREFGDQEAILGPQMIDRWSGAVLYEWREHSNSYGIVSYEFKTSAISFTGTGTRPAYKPTPISPDFQSLQSHWNTLTPTGTPSSDYTPTYTKKSCPTSDDSWSVAAAAQLPTIRNLVITTKPTASASAAARSSPVEAVAGASPTSASATTTTDPGSSGLSSGAKAAIGVSAGVGVPIIAVIAFVLWRRRRKSKQAAAADSGPNYSEVAQNTQGGGVDEFYKPEMEDNPVAQLHADDARQELGSRMLYQMADQEREPAELDASSRPQELSNGPSVRRPSRDGRF
ncbi:MAG: hypothetical protein Q9207_003340 [Kuettlingeria erythrocarpa]